MAAGGSTAAVTAPATMSPAGIQMYRAGRAATCARTSGRVYSQPVAATCTEEPRKSSQARPPIGAADAGGARRTAAPNAPALRATVPQSQARD